MVGLVGSLKFIQNNFLGKNQAISHLFKIAVSIWLLFISNNLRSQSVSEFYQRFSINNGLSSNTCNTLLEDSKGYIWIGTSEGLNRFDGHQVKQYFHNPADTTTLCGNTIKCLAEAPDGKIWIGTYGSGIGVFDPIKETFEHYQLQS